MLSKNTNELPITKPGLFLYHCLSRRRKIALENINRVFKNTIPDDHKHHLAKAFFSHLALSLKESYLTHRGKTNSLPQLEIRGVEHLREALGLGKGVIVFCAHYGNWEYAIPACVKKIDVAYNKTYIIRRLQSAVFQKILIRLYDHSGIKIIAKKGALRAAQQILANKNILIFVLDQHVSLQKNIGIAVEFFGEKAGCSAGLAHLARITGASVVPVNQFRAATNQHVLEFHPAVPWINSANKEQTIYDNTLQYNRLLEQFILQNPEQWWGWIHRRWKLDLTDPENPKNTPKVKRKNHFGFQLIKQLSHLFSGRGQ